MLVGVPYIGLDGIELPPVTRHVALAGACGLPHCVLDAGNATRLLRVGGGPGCVAAPRPRDAYEARLAALPHGALVTAAGRAADRDRGGARRPEACGSVALERLELVNGIAARGAAVLVEGGELDATDCILAGHRAAGRGGAVHVAGGSARLSRVAFRANAALAGAPHAYADGRSALSVDNGCSFADPAPAEGAGGGFTRHVSEVSL